MDFFVAPFFAGLILVPITLLPIIKPLSTAPVFAATVGRDRELAIRLGRVEWHHFPVIGAAPDCLGFEINMI